MNRTIGFIGSGNIGIALARLAIAAGLDVVLSNSRGPETLAPLVTSLGERARAAVPAEVAYVTDLVVATIPLHAYDRLPAKALARKTVIDTMNYYPDRDGHITELDGGGLTSSELVQRHLSDSRVVKAFNNIDFRRLFALARHSESPDRSALPIAGNDLDAVGRAAELLDTLGYDAVDIGPLADSWRTEPGTPVYVKPYFPAQPAEQISQEERYKWFLETPGTPVPAGRVKDLVAAALRNGATP